MIPSHVPADRVISFDPLYAPGLNADVHATTEEGVRASPPMAWTTANGGHWVAFGRAEIERIFTETDNFSSRQLSLRPPNTDHKLIPLQLDPPAHTPYRHVLLKHLGPKEVRRLESFVREWAEKLINPLAGKTECDFIAAVGELMPVSVFMETMGLPLDRFYEFRDLVATLFTGGEASPEAQAAWSGKIIAILADLIEQRRKEPRDDLISKLLDEQIEGRPLRQDELLNMGFLLFVAGLDTVTNAMGFGMRHLATDFDLQNKIRADRSLIPTMVEDLLRKYTFVNTVRVAVEDVEIGGVKVLKDEPIVCSLWGASNDGPVEGSAARHFAFGYGPHMCLGMHLARLELRVMYEVWFEKLGPFRLAQEPAKVHGGVVMGMTSLPLLLEPKRAA